MQSRTFTAMVLAAGTAFLPACTPRPLHAQQTPGELKGSANTSAAPQNFRWQRIITPPPSAPLAEACVILDAETFSNAAPALRDLRLYQDGLALPYAIEESFDERALRSGITPENDRSFYETASVSKFLHRQPAGIMGSIPPLAPPPYSTMGSVAGQDLSDPSSGYVANSYLPGQVPIERIRVEPAPQQREHLWALAYLPIPRLGKTQPKPSDLQVETADGIIDPAHPVLPFTFGANLQEDARVDVVIKGSKQRLDRVIFEMRRRSLCYQPRSASPLLLYLGGGNTMPAESYSFARTFQSSTDRVAATMGPLLPNPLFHPQAANKFSLNRTVRTTITLLALVALLLFNTQRLFRKFKGSPAPQQGSST